MSAPTRMSVLALLAAAIAVTGCFKLARTSPPVERFVLGGAELTPALSRDRTAASSATPGLSIGLRRLDLAPYLATLAIVVRRADNEIVTTGFQRWAEGPGTGLNRAVSGYLAGAPGIRSVDVAPWPIRAEHDYLLQLHVTRLEGVVPGGPGARRGEAHVMTRWELVRPSDGALAARGVTDYRSADWVVDDYADLVSRLDKGLIRLSLDVAACLQRLGSTVAPPADSVPGARDRIPTVECGAP